MLEIRGVAKRFGPTVALAGVDLALAAGEVHALIGENGAGKTTLMNILAGAMAADSGEMRVDGQPYAPATPLAARRHGIALIHQELSLCPHLSVVENILLGAEPTRWGGSWIDVPAARQQARRVLATFGHPDLPLDARVGDLRLADRQVVEICRALAADARIVLMDEPTSTLPRGDVDRLFGLIRQLAARGIAVLYISHFLEEVRAIAGRYTVLRDGRSVASGSMADTDNGRLIAQMVGRPVGELFPARSAVRAGRNQVVFAAEDVAAPPVLQHASFELREGEILGIAGLMGSGRTELVRALFGLDRRAAGRLRVGGATFAVGGGGARPAQRLELGIGYLSEDRRVEGLALPLSIADNLTASRLSACARRWGWLDLERQARTATDLMTALHIRADTCARPVHTLSGGNQQKVVLGRLLHQDARVLLLDEPTRGIDVGSRAQIYELIARVAADGRAVLLVSSYLPELFGLCHRLAVMSRGRLSAARPIAEWTPTTVLAAAIGGGSGGA
ncbi:MAG TPA: sugar ABC transporter ATP-binding protein [Gemmatimonadales bacterium]|nr:sugar ABC transporter ATP-binding protein [Gemmatimonadales bacterium]